MRGVWLLKNIGGNEMNKIKEALWTDYNAVTQQIKSLTIEDYAKYESLLEERDKLRNELIKLEQTNIEANVKKSQIEAEDKREKVRNQITLGTFAVSTGISMYAIAKTFKFDQVATVTSTLGRNILNGVVPKMFKR